MAVKGTYPIKVEINLQGLGLVLRSAVCEWLLLFFLLLDATFSYFLTKFAQYCELQVPCIFCSRLDQFLGKENSDFCYKLLCNDHISEISSQVSCHNHGKLADIRGMCEECLMSFAKRETNEETYRLLVGKLGPVCLPKPFESVDHVPGSFSTKFCSCCSKPWRTRPHVQKLVQSKPSASVSKPDIPLPKSSGYRCLNRQDGLKKRKDRFTLSTTPLVLGSVDFDTLSHVGYTEVKINSDSDSDFIFSDDDDIFTAPKDHKNLKNDHLFQHGSKLLPKKQHDNNFPAEQILKSSQTSNILMHPNPQLEKGETTTPKFPSSNCGVKPNFAEITWQQIRKRASPLLPQFTSLDDIPLSPNSSEISAVKTTNEVDRVLVSEKISGSGLPNYSKKIASLSGNITQQSTPQSLNMYVPVKLSKENWVNIDTRGTGYTSANNTWESIDLSSSRTVLDFEADFQRNDSSVTMGSCSTSDPKDLASSTNKEVKASDLYSDIDKEDFNWTDSTEELSASEAPTPYKDSSCDKGHAVRPSVSKAPDSVESQTLSKLPSLERVSSPDLSEGNCETEAESLADKLRQETENDKKRISDLYKELEEERNAAAIAANQAMAMITKLQEEKAALNMEALQYLRMMEEQAEYDVEALEKANDMIAEKEKEIQDLQAELDYYRMKYPEEFEDDSDIFGQSLADGHGSYTETMEFEKS